MDELIEEVYMELKDATEIEHATIDDEAAAGNLQRKEHDQAQRDLDSANVECQAEPSTRTIEVDVGPQQQHIVSEERFIMHEKQGDDEGMQHKINQQSADDKKYETSDVQREEQENKYSDDLEEQQQLESKSAGLDGATLVLERKHLKDNQGSWTEGQNHAQIPVQENIGATAEQMLLTEDKDEYSGDPTLKAVAEKKFQPQPLEIELNLVPGESQKQESDGIEQQDQLKGGEMKIIGKKKIREGDCPLIEKESQIKEAFEILEEQNQQIEQPEVIIETNQPDKQHCILVELQEFEHCDELTKVEQQKNEEKCPSGETKVDEHPHEQHNEDQQEKAVEKAEGTQPIEKSKRMGTETLKVGDNAENSQNIILTFEGTSGSKTQNKQKNMEHKNKCGDAKYISERQSDITSLEMSTEVKPVEDPSTTHSKLQPKQTMVKPQCRQLRPRPPKCRPDQTKEQFDLPNLEKSHEANQRRKLRPRPSKNESTEVENRAESFTARAESRKRLEIGGRRSLRPRSN
ncbi:hypothetical protein CDL12_01258 [Handroanthus impetiginosus]|uniref:Uncharacterized protein n=1 Tax=Handroanthus impetiginosus TaxID=429701 RepID=A0A2G9I899_9LAMI|nr:hypothetical protein CDL12_01258 [Handroanthus impetiginosus]